ncbi:hypothetical protein ERJ75_000364800 [Trypanosoma vivax]|nr:hypothetical protein ERJ75_000364800 [Trypanosoma vivax]
MAEEASGRAKFPASARTLGRQRGGFSADNALWSRARAGASSNSTLPGQACRAAPQPRRREDVGETPAKAGREPPALRPAQSACVARSLPRRFRSACFPRASKAPLDTIWKEPPLSVVIHPARGRRQRDAEYRRGATAPLRRFVRATNNLDGRTQRVNAKEVGRQRDQRSSQCPRPAPTIREAQSGTKAGARGGPDKARGGRPPSVKKTRLRKRSSPGACEKGNITQTN